MPTDQALCAAAISPLDGTDRLALLKAADQVLYRAKQAGRNRVAGPNRDDRPSAGVEDLRRTV